MIKFRINYAQMLKNKKDKKFQLLNEIQLEENMCNYSEGGKCKYCTNTIHCPFDEKVYKKEKKIGELMKEINNLKEYLIHGKGTIGYDKERIRLKLIKLNKKLKEMKKWE